MAKKGMKKSGASPTVVRFQRDTGKKENKKERAARFQRYVQEKCESGKLKYASAYKKEIDVEKRTLVAVASTGAIDRHSEIIDPAGWDTRNFDELNPVILWAHDYKSPPIGRSLWTKMTDDALLFKMEFAPTPFANELFLLYQLGFLNAFSVGFDPSEWKDGDGSQGWYTMFTDQELLEISGVTVPANHEAVVLGADDALLRFKTVVKSAIRDSGMKLPAIREYFEEINIDLDNDEDDIDLDDDVIDDDGIDDDVVDGGTDDGAIVVQGDEEEFEDDNEDDEDGDSNDDEGKGYAELKDVVSHLGNSIHESNLAIDVRIDGLEGQVENMLDLVARVMKHVGLVKDTGEIEDDLDLEIDDDTEDLEVEDDTEDQEIDDEQIREIVSEMVLDNVSDIVGKEFARLRGKMFTR